MTMFRSDNGTDPETVPWLDFPLRDITGRWVSPEGAPSVRIFQNDFIKNGGLWLELAYNNPQAVYARPVEELSGLHYFDLFGRVGIAYDKERDVLLLSIYGEYVRTDE